MLNVESNQDVVTAIHAAQYLADLSYRAVPTH